MRRRNSVLIEQEDLVIPAGIDSLAAFRRWAISDEFPENGRIDYLAGTIDADFSLEKLHSHGSAKSGIATRLYGLIVESDLREVFIDEARVSSEAASLSVEPDIVAVLAEGSYREMEPDSRDRLASPLLGLSFRLLRHLTPVGTFRYQLERSREAAPSRHLQTPNGLFPLAW